MHRIKYLPLTETNIFQRKSSEHVFKHTLSIFETVQSSGGGGHGGRGWLPGQDDLRGGRQPVDNSF